MLRFFIFIVIALTFTNTYSQVTQNEDYQFFVNLNDVSNDQLKIELITPKINSDKISYKFPAMVPGTYKIYNFGRFISEFQAYDRSGNSLSVNKADINTWEISDANKLYRITYKMDDTYEDTTGNSIFEPAGTSIEEGKIFVVNNQGFFGYFSGLLSNNYILNFSKPAGFFGSTSLNALERTDTQEIFTSPGYQFLVDNPIFFNVPDTASIIFDEANILISVYSPTKSITANDLAEGNKELLSAIRTYLGGKLPVEKYTFLYYFSDNKKGSGGFGALEHNLSSLYYMPNVPKEAKLFMINQLKPTNAHEFYHTVTPLNLHSEEIGNFDFNDPKMSEHLWLYEGVTEYQADYIQLREGLTTLKDYPAVIDSKLNGAARYNDSLPFTEMSKGALDIYEPQYNNVYEKGALIGLCLDILIREQSNGKQGIQDVINKLQEKYGKEKSFRDEDLFGDIEALTSPVVKGFLDKYVAGPNKIPYEEIFSKVGFDLKKKPFQVIDFGGIQIGFNPENYRMKIKKIEQPDDKFIFKLGVKDGDELVS
ncbi:MAG: peptidase M61, partial [bacterium]